MDRPIIFKPKDGSGSSKRIIEEYKRQLPSEVLDTSDYDWKILEDVNND